MLALGAAGVQAYRRVLKSPRPHDRVPLADVTGAPLLEVVERIFWVVRSAGRLVETCVREEVDERGDGSKERKVKKYYFGEVAPIMPTNASKKKP